MINKRLFVIITCFLLLNTISYADTVIFLEGKIDITHQLISLADIIKSTDISDENKKAFSKIYVGILNDLGEVKKITREQIKSALKKNNYDISKFKINGAEVVTVRRVISTKENVVNDVKSFLKAYLLSFLYQHFSSVLDAELDVEIVSSNIFYSNFDTDNIKEVKSPLSTVKNVMSFIVTTVDNKSYVIIARIRIFKYIAVAIRNIPPNKKLTSSDVAFRRCEVSSDSDYFTSIKEIENLMANTKIPQGKIIDNSVVKKIPVIKRRNNIKVRCKGKGFYVEIDAIAQEDGAINDIIRVRNKSSRKEFYARVVDCGIAELVSNEKDIAKED